MALSFEEEGAIGLWETETFLLGRSRCCGVLLAFEDVGKIGLWRDRYNGTVKEKVWLWRW